MLPKSVTSESRPSSRYGYMGGKPFGYAEFTAITAKDMGICYKVTKEEKANKTVVRVFNKKRFKKFIDVSSLIVTVQGVAKTLVTLVGSLIKHVRSIDMGSKFGKFKSTYGFGFNALDVIISSYALYDDSIHGYKAYKISDQEGVKDSSVNVLGSSTNIASIGAGTAAFIYKIKNAAAPSVALAAKSAACSIASSILGAIAFSAYTVFQAVGLKRVCVAAIRLRNELTSSKSIEQKYIDALTDMKSLISVTDKEHYKIGVKVNWNPQQMIEEIKKLLKKKHNKLVRRVGEDLAQYIEKNLDVLIAGFSSGCPAARKMAFRGAATLLNQYRVCLNKHIKLKIFKVVGGALGAIACLMTLSTPVGAAVLFGLSTVILIRAWYLEKYHETKKFNHVGVCGAKFFEYKVPIRKAKTVTRVKRLPAAALKKRVSTFSLSVEDSRQCIRKWEELADRVGTNYSL
ncbi:MAG: hypothetical protein S4CHLAM6_00890 [Chlamydiae bacterium]|nr:hypothetical protein [Chlamydiota bacterium]